MNRQQYQCGRCGSFYVDQGMAYRCCGVPFVTVRWVCQTCQIGHPSDEEAHGCFVAHLEAAGQQRLNLL